MPPETTATAAESTVYESPSVRLDFYHEESDGSLSFVVTLLNPSLGPLTDSRARVVLYDASGASLIEKEDVCGRIEAYSGCTVQIRFGKSVIPAGYAAYNIFAKVTTPGGETLTAQLGDDPLSGEEGMVISQDRKLLQANVLVDWDLPPDGYRPGKDIRARMEINLLEGQVDAGRACLRITELRQYATGQDEALLAEGCEQVPRGGQRDERYILDFEPSGFTWISQESSGGTYTPLEIKVYGTFTYRGRVLAEDKQELYLPPIEVISGWWEREGVPMDKYIPGEWYTANIAIRALADDPSSHKLQLSVRYTEQDPEEWLLSGLLLFIPCLFGLCTDEAEVLTQAYDIQLVADEDKTYSLRVQPPQNPTGEVGVGGYFYLALAFDGTTIWRGGTISPVAKP